MLLERAADGKPLRVALIGAGKFGSMYLAQAQHTPGIHVVAVVDLDPGRARAALLRVGWAPERLTAHSLPDAARNATTWITDDAAAVIAAPETEIVIDATGSPAAGIDHVLQCCAHGTHIVMVNVEADALAGPLLAATCARSRHRVLARVRRPAGADLRDGRLVPRRRLRGRCRREGNEVPARVSRVDARHRVAALRILARSGRRRRLQRADVQFVPRRHQERDRDGGGGECDRPAARPRRTRVSALRRRRPAAPPASRATKAASCTTWARSRSSRASNATAVPCSATCAGACT